MYTIDDLISTMQRHTHNVIRQNDAINEPEYKPYIGTVEEFICSELYPRIADAQVNAVYAEDNGDICIRYWREFDIDAYMEWIDHRITIESADLVHA